MEMPIFILLTLQLLDYILCDGCGTYWTKLLLGRQIAEPNNPYVNITKEVHKIMLITNAQARCGMFDWCYLVCKDTDGTFILSDVQVSPLYKDTVSTQLLTCYTKLRPDLAFGKNATDSGNQQWNFPDRKVYHIVDGLNDRNWNDLLQLRYYRMWFVVDLGKQYDVRSVYLTGWPTGPAGNTPPSTYQLKDIEIRVGNVSATEFSSYIKLGYFKGPAQRSGERIEIRRTESIIGRYVSAEKFYNDTEEQFLVFNVEIFSY